MKKINLPLTEETALSLKAGDSVLLSGYIYTSRDTGYKRVCETVAYKDLGAEALRKLYVEYMPLTVIVDCFGNNLYKLGRESYLKNNSGF